MSRWSRCTLTGVFLALMLPGLAVAAENADAPDLVLILDASGSMWGQIEGENKIVIARRVLGGLIDDLPDSRRIGLIAYGHRREGDCEDIELVTPLAKLDRETLKTTVDGLNPKGKTPITGSIQQAVEVIESGGAGATVVLVSDGLETCGGDPCELVRAVRRRGVELLLHVIGFDVSGEDVSQLECAAQAGGGMFLSAENADELSEALAAVAAPVEIPPGRLSVKAVANGELLDVAVLVTEAATGEEAAGGRTYSDPSTNPRLLPLADGTYDVKVQAAAGLRGDVTRRFQVEIVDGSTVEKEVDFSTGTIVIGVQRNAELHDAVFKVLVAGTRTEVDSGRTYTSAKSNPAVVKVTAGEYEVEVHSVKIQGDSKRHLGRVTVEPGGRVELSHTYTTGTLSIGVTRGSELVDAVVQVRDASNKQVAQGRTYTHAKSNPKSWELLPGDYTVQIREIRGEQRELAVSVAAGDSVERMVDLGGP